MVNSDGTGSRKLGTLTFVRSAVWDPTGRFVAYTGPPDTGASPMVLRIVELVTGAACEVPLGNLALNPAGPFLSDYPHLESREADRLVGLNRGAL